VKKTLDVYAFTNGMLMVFDTRGQQVSALQGHWRKALDKARAAADDATTWNVAKWREWARPAKFEEMVQWLQQQRS
jgi:hypothetical protein